MKKLTIILLMIPILAGAQIAEDKIHHFSCGAMIAGVANITTYDLIKDTRLKPSYSKIVAMAVGLGIGMLAGHAKEIYDEKQGRYYSHSDYKATGYGALFGTVSVRLVIWNSVPKSHVPIKDLWEMEITEELLQMKKIKMLCE